MSPSHQYRERDYQFANTFISLRTIIGLTQQGLAKLLEVSSRAIENWEQGLTSPKAEHLKAFLSLCLQSSVLPAGREEEQIRVIWRTAGLKVLLDEHWLSELLTASSPLPSEGGGQGNAVASQPLSIWMVPYIRNSHFTGRDELLSYLQQRFAPREAEQSMTIQHAALTQSQAIKGLGGIGKTQAAIEYAYRAREQGRYTHTIWVSASSEETVLTSFAALRDVVPALRRLEENDQRAVAKAALRWLEQCLDPWLLIYDNADDLLLLPPYLPKAGRGNILLTTRASAAGALAASLEVEVLPLLDGVQLLLHRAGYVHKVSEQEQEKAREIVLALGQFPLAIDQAGAYIEETGCSLSDYLEIYQQHQYELLAQRGKQATGYPDSVATTWSLAFGRVEQTNPAAAELLRLCAFVAPDQLPEELLTEGAPHWPTALQEAVRDQFWFNQMLSTLLRFSLIKRVGRERMLSLHRLVQVVQRERMTPEEQRQWVERLVCAMYAIIPLDSTSWSAVQRCLDQAIACAALINQYYLRFPEAVNLLSETGDLLAFLGLQTQAEPLLLRSLNIREQQMGPQHHDVALSLCALAKLYWQQGKHAQAESLFQRVLHILEEHVMPEHAEVAYNLHNLASLYWEQGKYAQAKPLFQQALHICEEHVLLDASFSAFPLLGLAGVAGAEGNYEEAERLARQALFIWEEQLGPEHLDVTNALWGLANITVRLGKESEAEALYGRALSLREQHLGVAHIQTAQVLHDFAASRHLQGRFQEAADLYQRALSTREEILGLDHPFTSDTRNRLQSALVAQDQTWETAKLDGAHKQGETAEVSSQLPHVNGNAQREASALFE